MRRTRTLSPAQQRRLDHFMARTWESRPCELKQEQIEYQQLVEEEMNAHDNRDSVRRMMAHENYHG